MYRLVQSDKWPFEFSIHRDGYGYPVAHRALLLSSTSHRTKEEANAEKWNDDLIQMLEILVGRANISQELLKAVKTLAYIIDCVAQSQRETQRH